MSPRPSEWPPRRAPEDIHDALMAACPDALQKVGALLGPYATFEAVAEACNAWARDKSLQVQGTFTFRKTTRRRQQRTRGDHHKVECNQAGKLNCKYHLCYEQDVDLQYRLVGAQLDHQPGCRTDPALSAGKRRAKSDLFIPEELL